MLPNYIFSILFLFLFFYSFVRPFSSIYSKLFLILGSLMGFISVMGEEYAIKLANSIGIGRGADLFFYLGLITIFLYILYNLEKNAQSQKKITDLSRKLALLEKRIDNSD